MTLRNQFTDLIAVLQRLPIWRLWLLMVLIALGLSEVVVIIMGQLLLGRVTPDYLLTGLVTSLLVGSIVVGLILLSAEQTRRLAARLTEREARYRLISNLSSDFIFSCTSEEGEPFKIDWLAGSCEALFGLNAEQMIARNCWRYAVLPEDLPSFDRHVIGLEPGHASECELRIRHTDGSIRHMHVSTKTLLQTNGKVYHRLYGSCRDITEQKRAEQAIRESELKYRSLFETANDGIFLQDETGFLDCNRKGAEMYGLTPEEVVGRSPATLCPELQPDGRPSAEVAAENIAMAMSGERPYFEWQPQRADGTPFDVEVNLSRIELRGKPCLLAIVRDITARKKAERELLRQHILRQYIIESLPGIFYLFEPSGRILLWNRNFETVIGLDSEGIKDAQPLDLFSPEERPRIAEAIECAMSAGRGAIEAEVLTPGGARTPYLLSNIGLNLDGQAIVIGLGLDISERKREEAELLRLSSWNTLLLNSAGEGIFGVDLDLRCTFINPAALTMLGFGQAELLGADLHQLFHQHYPDGSHSLREDCPVYQTLKDGTQRQTEDLFLRKSGESFAVQLTVTPMLDGDKIIGGVVVFRDITELKEMERELMRLATRDPLTGVANRRHFLEQIVIELARSKRFGKPASFLMLDLDHFKDINDTYGHAIGDAVLKHFAKMSRQKLRRIDLFGRLGGEEFGILLPGSDIIGAQQFAERFRCHIADTPAVTDKGPIAFTVSIGVTEFDPEDSLPDSILARADVGLYRAKAGGRNRVEAL
jgi:diguanylate cyclase (GGDEF)-like protein/PAS domain S-box-containing protein